MEQNEPSMEEILSSIRRILSHEEESATHNDESLKDSVSTVALKRQEDTPDVMELTPDMRIDEDSAPEHYVPQSDVDEDMVLLSEAVVQASADRLHNLVHSVATENIEKPKKAVSESGNLEDIVTALLRPYLKEWLDAHLPALVEKVVQKEVERVVQKAKLS